MNKLSVNIIVIVTLLFFNLIYGQGVAPTLLSPSTGSNGIALNPTLSWNPVAGATSYSLQISTDSINFAMPVVNQIGLKSLTYKVTGLANNTKYYWHVNETFAGNVSAWSSFMSFTTILVPPELLTPSNNAANVMLNSTLAWNVSDSATSYALQVSTDSTFSSMLYNEIGLTNLSLQVSGLLGSTKYYWHVHATNSGDTSTWSNLWSFLTVPPIAAPPILSLPVVNSTSVAISPTLSWNSSNGAIYYRLQVSTNANFTSTIVDDSTNSTTSMAIGPLIPSTTYYWRVNAINAAGTSAWSALGSFSTMFVSVAPVPILSSPQSGVINVTLNPTLSWDSSSGAATYHIQVSADAGFSNIIVDDSTPTGTSKVIGPLASSTSYFWRVNAKNAAGTSVWSMIWSFSTVLSVTGAPILSSPSNGLANIALNPTLSWGATNGAATYRIQVSTDSGFGTIIVDDSTVTTTSKAIGPLSSSTIYYWRVNAKNAGGTSTWSNKWSFSTVPPIAATPILIAPANSSINNAISPTLSWNSSSGTVTYRVQVSTDSGFAHIIFDDSTATLTSVATGRLNSNTVYYWRANSKNPGGVSAWSTEWKFTTIATTAILPTQFGLRAIGYSGSTTILRYSLPHQCYVSLKCFDVGGRLVASFVNQTQNAGYYSFLMPISHLAKGTYIQEFRAGDFLKEDRLVIMR